MPIVDTHVHHYPSTYLDGVASLRHVQGEPPAASPPRPAVNNLAEIKTVMRHAGVDLAILGVGSHQPWGRDAKKSLTLAQMCNDYYHSVVAASGGTLAALGCVPLPHVDLAIQEANRCLDELGMCGLSFGAHVLGEFLDNAEYTPLFESLDQKAAVIQIHPVAGRPGDYGLGISLQGPAQVAMACARIWQSGLASRHPRIRFVATGMGGGLPFIGKRVAEHAARGLAQVPPFSENLPLSMYFDTEGATAETITCISQLVGRDRIIFGTNYPHADIGTDLAEIRRSNLSAIQIRDVLGNSAVELFGLGVSHPIGQDSC